MRILSSLLLAGALAATATAPAAARERVTGEERLAQVIDGRTAGKPVSCINLSTVRSSEIIDGTAIVYRVGANRLYVNRPNGADTLDDDDILVTRTIGSQLCRIDTINLIDRSTRFPRGFVSLGDFVPYEKAAKPRT